MYILVFLGIIILSIIAYICFDSQNKNIRLVGLILEFSVLFIFGYIQLGSGLMLNPLFIIFYILVLFGIIMFIYKFYRNLKYKKESYSDINYLNRDISAEYPPSIVGYLFNNKLRYKDLIADIMELYAKKIIDISKTNINGKKTIRFYIIDKDYETKIKTKSQIYIINTLINNKININFDFKNWKKLVLKEYKKRGFAKQLDYYNGRFMALIVLSITILCSVIGYIYGIKNNIVLLSLIIGILGGAFIGTMIAYYFISFIKNEQNTNIFLSTYGKNELKKWIKFKNFIKEYTLLKEKTFEDIIIYESYIPYAVALDINVKYKDTKFDIFTENEFKSITNENNIANFLQNMEIDV